MKTLLQPMRLCILMLVFLSALLNGFSQKNHTNKVRGIEAIIAQRLFTFHAEYAHPMTGQPRYLSSDYKLTLAKDSLNCDLPYFGRIYTAPVDPTAGGIKLISTQFDYKINPKKKRDGWEITIKPMVRNDIQSFYLTVYKDGSGTLQVISTNRQPISYNGYLSGIKKENKN